MDANDYAVKYGLDALREFLEEKPNDQNRIFVRGGDFAKSLKTRSWLIKPILPSGESIICVFGPSGAGKSHIVKSFGMAVALNRGYLFGHKSKGGNVAFVLGEGYMGYKERILVDLQENGGTIEDFNKHSFISQRPIILDNQQSIEAMTKELDDENFKPDLVIVDTLASQMEGNESDAKDAGKVLRNMGYIARKYNCCVVYVHHTGVNSEAQDRQRGSSAFKGGIDMEYNVCELTDGTRQLKHTKCKDGAINPCEYFYLEPHFIEGLFDEDGEAISSVIVKQAKAPEPEKTQQQSDYETLLTIAVEKYAYMDADGTLYISRADMLQAITGKLTNKDGEELAKASLQNQLNPTQSGFAKYLEKEQFIECIKGSRGTITKYKVINQRLIDYWKEKQRQQGELLS